MEFFLPHIAIAYGYASSFSDPRALSFDMSQLFEPNFGADLSNRLLSILQSRLSFFDQFNRTSSTGMPMTFEGKIFRVQDFLPELQFALDLSPGVEFPAGSFRTADLYDALFPSGNVQSLKSFGSFIKKKVVSKISNALIGLFDVMTDVPSTGLTVDEVKLGGTGLSLGDYSSTSTQLFPPAIDVDTVQVSSSNCPCVFQSYILTYALLHNTK